MDQKYEKVATIESQSPDIENDEKKVRDLINSTGSIVQYENSSGLKQRKNRVIKLAVDVPPEKFDELVNEFKQIGKNVASNDR
ncbi:PF14257 domain protein [Leptospira alstonii]|uniref:PF14257 domain protein n=2 Tax=Leptospira alstonii TaxID=28452 RepID=M6D5N5_9LEPT|nr:PF14257 domain protein [Leptospira alstonii]EMJ93875.1 PF14257 domain protein [Leptospira alstonii serovar Sichuan str. 79601]EQA80181.1 PF14257 domain protein [Leptospira alstonii serovar Pingchang str. 80-412]